MRKMKSVIGVVAMAMSLGFVSCGGEQTMVVSQDLKFCESVLAYENGALIANFGSSELNPLNSEGRGYINYYVDGVMRQFIPADGNLSAPKGLLVCGDKLYVADVNKIVVYDLSNIDAKPMILSFPESDPYVNHLVQVGNAIFVTVTNSGNIFTFDIDEESMPIVSSFRVYQNIPGANGLLYADSSLYIASYPADGVTTAANVIYKIDDLANPTLKRVTERAGQYDGLALVGDDLYFTDWQGGIFGKLSLASGEVTTIHEGIGGPAEIDVIGDKIAVPDLVNSVVYLFDI